jgi:hypothetical protein
MQYVIFAIIFISQFFTTPLTVLFYDQPEYLRIVATNSFWQVFSLGHFPIHPIFMGILWIGNKIISANLVALTFGIISTLLVYKISKIIFKKGQLWIPAVIFSLLPAVWIINTNLMVQSLSLPFYLFSIYYFLQKRKISFILSLFLMIGIHIESIAWTPTIFLIPFIFDIKFGKKEFIKHLIYSAWGVFAPVIFYVCIYYFAHLGLSGSDEQLKTYFSSGVPRMIRNIWLSFARGFGSLTPIVLFLLLLKNIKTKKVLFAWIAFFAIFFLIGANWQGDFMVRRMIFGAVIIALAIYKYLGKYSVLFILYLIPIIIANGILYYRFNPNMSLIVMQKRIDKLPVGEVLIESRYYQPFVKYEGTVLWVGVSDLNKIDDYLKEGKRVFMEKRAITAPYMLFVGNNYHITSLGRVGESESRFLFEKYSIEAYGENMEIKLFKGKVFNEAGEPVIFYDSSFWGRLARGRIDYGDIGTWIWASATNHRDPTGWTYKDARGIGLKNLIQ